MADLTATTVALSPFAYYRLNEAAGTVATDTQGHSNGTYTGTYTLGATPNTANDTGNVSLGGAGYVTTNLLASDAGLTGANFSVSFFFTFGASFAGGERFVANGHTDSGDKGFQFYNSAVNTMQFDVRNTALVSATNLVTIGSGTVIHVVGVVDAVNNRTLLYVNGVAGTAVGYQAMAASPFVTAIGVNPAYTGDYAKGVISEVSFYNTALTAANVTALYAARTVVPTSGTTYNSANTAGLSFVGSQTKRVARSFTAATSFVGAYGKGVTRPFAAVLSSSAVFARSATRSFTATLTSHATFSAIKTATASLTFIGSQSKVISRALTASLTPRGTIGKAASRLLTASTSFIGTKSIAPARSFTASVTPTATETGRVVVRNTHAETGAVSFVGGVGTQYVRVGSIVIIVGNGSYSGNNGNGASPTNQGNG